MFKKKMERRRQLADAIARYDELKERERKAEYFAYPYLLIRLVNIGLTYEECKTWFINHQDDPWEEPTDEVVNKIYKQVKNRDGSLV